VTKASATRILDELCATTARIAITPVDAAAEGRQVQSATATEVPAEVIAALVFCWAVLGMPAGKRCCVGSASWTLTRAPRRCWRACRRPPSIGDSPYPIDVEKLLADQLPSASRDLLCGLLSTFI
jgi:hypothetical protein